MSTKIYDGYVINEPLTLIEAKRFCFKLREKLVPVKKRLEFTLLAILATHNYDQKYIKPYKQKKSPLSTAASYINDEQRKVRLEKTRSPEADFGFELTFFPLRNRTLIIIYSEQPDLRKAFTQMSGVEFYGYWNNTDPDEECTAKEWRQRKNDWDKVLPDIGIPCENGFSFTILQNHYIPVGEALEVQKKIPTFKHRIERIASRRVMDRRFNKIHPHPEKKEDYHDYIRTSLSVLDWSRTTEGKVAIQKEIRKIKPRVKQRLTIHDLMEK